MYEGSRREKQIYLYHHDNHFDVITSVTSFLGESYWCLECKKGHDRKKDHCCNKECKCYFTEECRGIIEKERWRECRHCHGMYAGMIAITTTHDPTKQVSLFVNSTIHVRHAKTAWLTGKEVPMLTCVEKSCVGTVKSMLIPIHTCVI